MCSRYVTVHLNFLVSKYFIEKQADAETLKGVQKSKNKNV